MKTWKIHYIFYCRYYRKNKKCPLVNQKSVILLYKIDYLYYVQHLVFYIIIMRRYITLKQNEKYSKLILRYYVLIRFVIGVQISLVVRVGEGSIFFNISANLIENWRITFFFIICYFKMSFLDYFLVEQLDPVRACK